MQPIGQTILCWRNSRGLTQAGLARLSGVSRPNLSAIEQGARDLTMGTLRRIAAALGLNTGTLADGLHPEGALPKDLLNRQALDRIVRCVAGQKVPLSALERGIVADLTLVLKSKTGKSAHITRTRTVRAENEAILRLKAKIGRRVFEHLIRRIEKHLVTRWMAHE